MGSPKLRLMSELEQRADRTPIPSEWEYAPAPESRSVVDIDPDAGSLLFVEYHGSSASEAEAGFARMDRELDAWTEKILAWRGSGRRRCDVYVYFDNDAKVHAPFDALTTNGRSSVRPVHHAVVEVDVPVLCRGKIS